MYCEIVGLTEAEMLATTFMSLTHPDDLTQDLGFMERLRSGEISDFTMEKRYVRKDGSIVWVSLAVSPLWYPGEVPSQHIAVVQEITARKRAEVERQKFVLLADHSVEFIGMCDLDFKPFYVNEAGRRLIGLDSMEQACSTKVQDFFFPEDRNFIANEFFPKVIRDGRNEVEIRFRHFKTGSAIWMIYNVFQVHDEAGQLVGYATVSRDITDRKQMEVALRESEARVRADLDAMIRLHDLSVLSMQNRNLQSVLEKIVDNAMAITGADFGNIQLLEPTSAGLRIVAQRGFPNWWVEFLDTTSGGQGVCGATLGRGERIIVEDVEQSPIFTGTRALDMQRRAGVRAVQSTPLMNRSGKMLGILSTHHKRPHRLDERTVRLLDLLARQAGDLIENAQDEEALHWLNATLEQRVKERTAALVEANERWDWVVRATNDGVWDWDLIHDTVYFSPRWRAVHGFQISDQPESMPQWSARIHPEDRPRVLKNLQDYLAGKCEKFCEEYRIRRNDGSYIWLLDRGIAIFDDEGRAIRMVGAETDITWRKEAEEVLRRQAHEFHALADNVPAFFSYIDQDRRYQFINKRYEEFFGRSSQEIEGTAVCELLGPDGYAQVEPYLDKALGGEPCMFEYELKIAGADTHYLSAQYVPDRDEQGQVAGLFVLQMDVTELKSSEEALRERETQLRDLSAKLLRTQEDERRRIARDLHDDVMQRMAALTMELQSLSSSMSSPDPLSSRLKELGERGERLTTDLQQMAHGLHPSILEHVGLEAAVREHVDDFASRSGLLVEVLTRDVPKAIPLDQATCLYRVLQESLQNVRKHANATNVCVRLLGTSHGIGLCVHDDGQGFKRASIRSGHKGLGLTSMAERVGALQGRFHARTKAGDGTEIHAWVPLEDMNRAT
jgi:PAS domain S-box-containing protein